MAALPSPAAFITSDTMGRPTSFGERPAAWMSPSLAAGLGLGWAWSTMNPASIVARFLFFSIQFFFRTTVPARAEPAHDKQKATNKTCFMSDLLRLRESEAEPAPPEPRAGPAPPEQGSADSCQLA